WAVGRALGRRDPAGGGAGPMLGSFRTFVRVATWLVAAVLILMTFGVNVTAGLAGLGVGGVGIGPGGQAGLCGILRGLIIFVGRRSASGDVTGTGADEPAKVVGLTWRMTQLKGADGLVHNIPNRKVTEQTIQNLTRAGKTYDWITASISTSQD